MLYDAYHDESKEAGYWHGILLVPQASRVALLAHLAKARAALEYGEPVTLKGIDRKDRKFQCARAWTKIGALSLIQDCKGKVEPVHITHLTYAEGQGRCADLIEITRITEPLGARFILFRERDAHRLMDPGGEFLDYGAKIETTFRMGLKGGLHFLFDPDNPAIIASMHFDGHAHHSGRHLDQRRIVDRLRDDLRDYCHFAEQVPIVDDPSDHRRTGAQPYDDCQFLQLTDLLVGSFRTVLAVSRNPTQAEVAYPVKTLVDRWRRGAARMANSRWHHGFCLTEGWLENGHWRFAEFSARDSTDQMRLL